jgi:uncharacterized membrane protein
MSDGPATSMTRTEALSDAVFAIAMTLLVLDLRTPEFHEGQLFDGLLSQWPAYLSFLASFLFIAVVWTNHRATFRLIPSETRTVTWANIGILGGAVLLPFPTGVVADAFRYGSHADQRAAVALYAGLAIVMTLAWLALFYLLHRRSYPMRAGESRAPWKAQMRRPLIGTAGYVCGIVVGLVTVPIVSLFVFLLVPLYYALTSEGLRSARRSAVSAPPALLTD